MLLEGLHVPLTVPFYRDGAVYYRKLEHNAGRLSLTPASALVALGFGSEAQSLTDDETAQCLRTVAEAAAKEKVLIARVERRSVAAALLITEQAAAAGYDAVLMPTPALWQAKLAADGATSASSVYLRNVADRSPLPVVLWSGDDKVHARVSEGLAEELATHPNIIGMYDIELDAARFRRLSELTTSVKREVTVTSVFAPVTGRMLRVEPQGQPDFVSAEALGGGVALATSPPAPALKTRTRMVGFQVLGAGSAANVCDVLQAGAPGVSPLLAAAAPQGCHEVLAAWKDGNPDLAREKQARLSVPDAVCARLAVSGLKYACDLNGYYGGAPRLPFLPLTAEGQAEIEAAFRYVRN